MKLKMYTPSGSVIVETNDVAQFYPDAESGGELTTIELVSPTGDHGKVAVNIASTRWLALSPRPGKWMKTRQVQHEILQIH